MNIKEQLKKITIVGAGNVGHNFAFAFKQAGYQIHQIHSRTQQSAMLLGQMINCAYTTRLEELKSDTDIIVLTVNDDALLEVVSNIQIKDKPIVHTSGSIPLSIFEGLGFENYGIFYPVQSFSKNDTESLCPIPICVEASNTKAENLFLSLAYSISERVYAMDSEKRKALHVAAVFANNFSNHLFHIADEILKTKGISFEVIRPLVEKTADKIKTEKPLNAQTGPAVRNDTKVIQDHIELLNLSPSYQELYKLLTASIFKAQQQK